LARLADYFYLVADYPACLQYANRLLENDACREDAHRLLMRCLVRQGERAQALRQYRLCMHILHAEFDTVPERDTTRLFTTRYASIGNQYCPTSAGFHSKFSRTSF
jgi:DNA-binding SARP family transcriptional activator